MSAARAPLPADEVQHLLAESLAASGAEATEARLEAVQEQLTRFANNQIHQHVAATDHVLTVRAFVGRRTGTASTNRLEPSGLRQAAERALALARLAPEEAALAPPAGVAACEPLENFVEATAACTGEERADALAPVLESAQARGLDAAGALGTIVQVTAIATTNGCFAYHAGTQARFTCTARGPDSSGWVSRHRRDWRDLSIGELGTIAIDKAERSRAPVAVEPGRWTVILEPAAVAELVAFLAPLGLGGRALLEGRSFMAGRIGERITGTDVTLRDDAWHPRGFGRPFDEEGTPRQRLVLIDHGVAKAAVHDRRTAALAGVESTGHAAPAALGDGPQPFDLVLDPGGAALEEMIASTERGLLVTRFWYNRVVDARRTIVTGMTRDGTFRVEDGRVVGGVRNLRFNESVLGALERADRIGAELEPTVFDWSGACVTTPALRVRDFTFSSVSPFWTCSSTA